MNATSANNDAGGEAAERKAAQAESGGRTMANPGNPLGAALGATGGSSELQPSGISLSAGSLGDLGSRGTPDDRRGGVTGAAGPGAGTNLGGTSGASGMPTNDEAPGGGTVGDGPGADLPGHRATQARGGGVAGSRE
jgi:hypothetical protein